MAFFEACKKVTDFFDTLKGGQKAAFKRILQVCIYASFTLAARFLPYMMMPTR